MPGYGNVKVFRRYQSKIEVVRGTAETTMTRPVIGLLDGGFSWKYNRDREDAPEALGTFHVDRDTALTNESVTINFEIRASFEEAIWWLNLALDGGNRTGTTTGSTPPGYTYTLTPNGAADDLDSATFKIGDGATAYRFRRCMVNTITFRCNPNAGGEATWRIAGDMLAIFDGTTTLDSPAGISRTMIYSNGTKMYFDTSSALGTTAQDGKVRNVSFTIANNLEEKRFMDSGTTAAADVGRGPQRVTGDFTVEHLSDATYFAIMRANTKTKIRFEYTGATIGATPTTNYLFQADFPQAMLNAPSESYAGQNLTYTYPFIAEAPIGGVPITIKDVTATATVTA
jgi:hypothetical protein